MTEQSCFHHKYFTKSISPKDFHYPQEIVELSIKIHIISSDAIEPYGHFFCILPIIFPPQAPVIK